MRIGVISALAALLLAGCTAGFLDRVGGPLFASSVEPRLFDFELDPLGKPPSGFGGADANWTVVDSPTAASGEQVLVAHPTAASRITLDSGAAAKEVRGEAAVRVFVGDSGAGVACASAADGYAVRAEPAASRVALYRRDGEESEVVATHAVPLPKGGWIRLGILCGGTRVVAYLDGKPVASHGASPADRRLGLEADAGVVAQFDEVRLASR